MEKVAQAETLQRRDARSEAGGMLHGLPGG